MFTKTFFAPLELRSYLDIFNMGANSIAKKFYYDVDVDSLIVYPHNVSLDEFISVLECANISLDDVGFNYFYSVEADKIVNFKGVEIALNIVKEYNVFKNSKILYFTNDTFEIEGQLTHIEEVDKLLEICEI